MAVSPTAACSGVMGGWGGEGGERREEEEREEKKWVGSGEWGDLHYRAMLAIQIQLDGRTKMVLCQGERDCSGDATLFVCFSILSIPGLVMEWFALEENMGYSV